MNRCQSTRAHFALAASLALASLIGVAAPAVSRAQESVQRQVPKDVKLGRMTVVLPPVIQIDGKNDRLSPGARIHDLRNMQVLSGSLVGSTVPIVYKREPGGLVHEVWILSADEYRKLGGAGSNVQSFLDLLAAIFGARR